MGGVCGVSVGAGAVRIAYVADGRRAEHSMDAAGALDLLPGTLDDLGPFEDIVLAGRDTAVVSALLNSLGGDDTSGARMVHESRALLAYARTVPEFAGLGYVLVADLGKQGMSVTALDVAGNAVEWSARTADISGDRFDEIVRRIVMAKDILPPAVGEEGEREYTAFFRELKELVSASAGVRAPNRGPMLLTRDELERELEPLIADALDWASDYAPDAVLLIGGGAAIPAVRGVIEDKWGISVHIPDAPAMAIAAGAALDVLPERPDLVVPQPTDVLHGVVLDFGDEGTVTVPDDASGLLEFDTDDELAVGLDPDRREASGTVGEVDAHEVGGREVGGREVDVLEVGDVDLDEAAAPGTRRKVSWSLRDAAMLVAVLLVILGVAAVVYTRGITPPPTALGTEEVPQDPAFAATLAEAAGAADNSAPGPAEVAPVGPYLLPDADLYERVYTYTGDMYQPEVGPSAQEPGDGSAFGEVTGDTGQDLPVG